MSSTIDCSLNIDSIQREIDLGYISEQEHPTAPLRILNYTPRAQFDWHWTKETRQCRGLIVDNDWQVVARPFEKFFSVDQTDSIPVEPFDVYEKIDGSLGILYFIDDQPKIASRGSFTSDQARRATEILTTKYADAQLVRDYTYLFEIIYPENRIVVDYGDREDLILLAIIETSSGIELPLHKDFTTVFPVVNRYDGYRDFDELLSIQDESREGFVVRFKQSGTRVKIKFDEYKRLHKLLTGVSPKAIWNMLRSGGDLSELTENTPDEFQRWVQKTENDLRLAFATIEVEARSSMRFVGTRKELADRFSQCLYPGVMFSILDGKDYADQIWRIIKPSGEAFRCAIDT